MRRSATQKAETRKEILKVSAALTKKNGYSATGVDALVGAAGVTSGAFYNHFDSKAALFTELIAQELAQSSALRADESMDQPIEEVIARRIKRYLTWKHVKSPETGCVIPSLGAEIARADDATKQVFEEALKHSRSMWDDRLEDKTLAWAILAQLVGSILLARAMSSEKSGKEMLDASRAFLEKALALPKTP